MNPEFLEFTNKKSGKRSGFAVFAALCLTFFGMYLFSDYSAACISAASGMEAPAVVNQEVIYTETPAKEAPKPEAVRDDLDDDLSFENDFAAIAESDAVDDSYFDDAVFIGDSQIQGIQIYSGITNGTFYAEKGMSIYNIMEKAIVYKSNGSYISVTEALKENTFGKVYLKLGLNELLRDLSGIADKYNEVIGQIKTLLPDADVYVISVLPVTKYKDNNSSFKNLRIRELNEALKKVCWDSSVNYLDCYNYFADDEGNLPSDASSDGVHLNRSYSSLWYEYLKTHTVNGAINSDNTFGGADPSI